MNKVSCSVIQDILPLYIEGVVSKDTEKLVEEHLEHCEFCRCQVSKLTQNLVLPNEINVQLQEAQPLKEFKKNIKKKRNIISFLSVLITALVLIGGYSVLWVYGLPASHEGIIVKTEMQNYDEESIYPVWAIHFESRDGKALYVKTKFLYEENEEGEKLSVDRS